MKQTVKPVRERIALNVTSNFISRYLRYFGVIKPSEWYYEWTGTNIVSKTDDGSRWYFEDSINAYTEKDLDDMLPKNVAVNENVREIGYLPEDSRAEKKGKLLAYLLEKNIIDEAPWYRKDIREQNEKYDNPPEFIKDSNL